VKYTTIALLLFTAVCSHAAEPPTLILMGGSYRTCSSLLAEDCRPEQRDFPGARGAPEYRLDAARFSEILDPAYWQTRRGAPTLDALRNMLAKAHATSGNALLDAKSLSHAFESADTETWNGLLTAEQDLILSAFEQLQQSNGIRKREQVRLDGSNRPYDAALFRQLVMEAGKRSPGRKPRIAFTTSASINGFDAVDFYRDLLAQAGAEPVWWPIDAALAEARFGGTGGCAFLQTMRRNAFSTLGRERVFPDLDAEQKAACANPTNLDAVPNTVQALFLDGGDQWLHHQTFFTRDGTPNPWLRTVRAAFLRGDLVVAGTSAGAAVQSGFSGMVTNGTSTNALVYGAIAAHGSMPEGCERAKRCPIPLREDDLTWWHGGGLDLFGNYLVDTHVSERRRELRLIALMGAIAEAAQQAPEAGIGIDETSALTVRLVTDGLQLEASGQSGAWWFEPPGERTAVGGWTVHGHYLAPGAGLLWSKGRMQLLSASSPVNTGQSIGVVGGDALHPEVMRSVIWHLARVGAQSTELSSLDFKLRVNVLPASRRWQGPQGQQGITELEFTLARP
jgi:cyanophycinase-like exopeptidase